MNGIHETSQGTQQRRAGRPPIGFMQQRPLSSPLRKLADGANFLGRKVVYFGKGARDRLYPKYVRQHRGGTAPTPHRTLAARNKKPVFGFVASGWRKATLTWRSPYIRLGLLEQRIAQGNLFSSAFQSLRSGADLKIERAAANNAENVIKVIKAKLDRMDQGSGDLHVLMTKEKRASLEGRLERAGENYFEQDSECQVFWGKVDALLIELVKEFGERAGSYSHADVTRLKSEMRGLVNDIATKVSQAAKGDQLVDVDKILSECTLTWRKDSKVLRFDSENGCQISRPQSTSSHASAPEESIDDII